MFGSAVFFPSVFVLWRFASSTKLYMTLSMLTSGFLAVVLNIFTIWKIIETTKKEENDGQERFEAEKERFCIMFFNQIEIFLIFFQILDLFSNSRDLSYCFLHGDKLVQCCKTGLSSFLPSRCHQMLFSLNDFLNSCVQPKRHKSHNKIE